MTNDRHFVLDTNVTVSAVKKHLSSHIFAWLATFLGLAVVSLSVMPSFTLALSEAIPTATQSQNNLAKIVFVSERTDISGVYVMESDGENQYRLADGAQPTWSPDGKQIAFVWESLYIIDVDSRQTQRLTNDGNSFFLRGRPMSQIAFQIPWIR
jgi:hypothetical protein